MNKRNFLPVLLLFLCCSLAALCPALRPRAAEAGTPIRVACVGDSITFGFTSSDASRHSYPSQLQNLLGDGYTVANYGKSGFTLMKSGDKSYWNTAEYTNSLNSSPDLVILMLGTNDSKPVNWDKKENFLSDLKEMIQSYQELPSQPAVYVCTSPRMPQEYEDPETQGGLSNAVINDEIVPLQKQAAEETGCLLLDVNAFTRTELADEDFKDYAHPTDIGYQKLANFFYGALTEQEISMEIIDDSSPLSDGKGFSFQGDGWVSGDKKAGSINGTVGTEHYAAVTEENAASHTYEIAFSGTRIQVYGQLSPNHGIVKYSIDGGEETEFDSYSSGNSVSALLYQASGLANGPHILKATATGRKNAAAQNACIQVDYAKVFTEKRCTCAIESLSFTGGTITIPWDKDSTEFKLSPQCAVTPCELSAHQGLEPKFSCGIIDDTEGAVFHPDTLSLTVSKTGKLTVSLIAEIPGTGVAEQKDAVFEVIKEEAPKQEDDSKKPSPDNDPSGTVTPPPGSDTDIPSVPVNPAPPDQKQDVKLARPNLKVKKSGTKVKLSWKKNTKSDGYIIQMKTGKGKYRKIAAKKMKVTSFTKKKLKKNTVYFFRIRSYKKNGSSKIYSAWSKVKKIRL